MVVVITIVAVLIFVGIVRRSFRTVKGMINGDIQYSTRPMHYKKHGERNRRI